MYLYDSAIPCLHLIFLAKSRPKFPYSNPLFGSIFENSEDKDLYKFTLFVSSFAISNSAISESIFACPSNFSALGLC